MAEALEKLLVWAYTFVNAHQAAQIDVSAGIAARAALAAAKGKEGKP